MARILLVEDEQRLSELVSNWLRDELHTVAASYDGLDALRHLANEHFDLIILDLMLPGLDGIEVCKRYRAASGRAPIIILTAKRSLDVKESGLDSGADDYLTKPFKLRELSARVRALLRRPLAVLPAVLRVADLKLDSASCRVFRGEQEIRLVPKEFSLLEVLMKNAGAIVRTEFLITSIWGLNSNITPETIRSYVRLLRQKIDIPGQGSLIHNVHGVGYRLEAGDV